MKQIYKGSRYKESRYKKYRVLIFLCILFIAGNVYVKTHLFEKQLQRVSSLQTMISKARSDNKAAASRQGNTKTDLTMHLSKIMSAIDTKPYLGPYIDQVAKLIDKNRVRLDKGLVFEVKEAGMPFLVQYDSLFTVEGSYENIKLFISDMQNIRSLSYVRSAKMSQLEPGTNKLSLKMGISVYFKKRQV